VLGHAIGGLLPAALAVALSPIPIVAVVLVLDSPRAHRNGPAFALGWVAGLVVVSVVVVALTGRSSDAGSSAATGVEWGTTAIGALLLVMAARQWKKRPRDGETPEMPDWMATVGSMSVPKTLVLGAALSAANPKNLALTAAAAAAIAQAGLSTGDEAVAIAVFVAIGSCTVVGAVLAYLVAPRQVTGPLATVRQFMADNNATIMMVVLLLLGAKLLGDGLSGLWT
jgi:threonine/homoserine/homoserine lactone efflux protein